MAMAKIKSETQKRVTGGQGRVKDPFTDRRLAVNRPGPTGQGKRKRDDDKRLAVNRAGPTGQGRVKNPKYDRRLTVNGGGRMRPVS